MAAGSSSRIVSTSAARSSGRAAGCAVLERARQLREGGLEQPDQVDRVAPGVGLLHPLGAGQLGGQRGEHRLGAAPACGVERLQRLVHEVQRVAAVQVAVVGGGGEQHVGERRRPGAAADRRDERPLGPLGVADVDEVAEPGGQPVLRGRRAGERVEREAGRLRGGVGGHVGEPMVERRRPLRRIQPGQQVHQTGERGQPAEPAAAATGDTEVEPGPEHLDAARVGLQERDRRLRQDERDVPLQTVAKTLALVGGGIGERPGVDQHVVAVDGHWEAAQLVGELVERPAGCQVEAGVVPVAGEDAVAHRPPVQRKAHVRAAVVDRVHLVAVGEQADGVPVGADDQAAGRLELAERGDADESVGGRGLHARTVQPQPRLKSRRCGSVASDEGLHLD